MKLDQLQREQAAWAFKNFGAELGLEKAADTALGVAEEVGELCHALLKLKQGIRLEEDHSGKGQDAVGDIVIYLADLCTRMQWDFAKCVEAAWSEVSKRDWNKHRQEHADDQ